MKFKRGDLVGCNNGGQPAYRGIVCELTEALPSSHLYAPARGKPGYLVYWWHVEHHQSALGSSESIAEAHRKYCDVSTVLTAKQTEEVAKGLVHPGGPPINWIEEERDGFQMLLAL